MLQHLLRDRVIRDDALPQRTDRHDIARSPADHQPGLLANGPDLLRIPVKRNHRGFLQHHTLACDIY